MLVKCGVTVDGGGGGVGWSLLGCDAESSGEWPSNPRSIFLDHFNLKAVQPFETSGSIHPTTQRHLCERKEHRCENLKCRVSRPHVIGACGLTHSCCREHEVALVPLCASQIDRTLLKWSAESPVALSKWDRSKRCLPTAVSERSFMCVDLISLSR
jgi:hypothetical protein